MGCWDIFRASVVVVGVLGSAGAQARPLDAGELWGHRDGWSGNAYTVPRGRMIVHPFLRSGIGWTDAIDTKSSVLGWIDGPNLGAEFRIPNDRFTMSLEVDGRLKWGFREYNTLATLHLSSRDDGGQLNISVTGGLQRAGRDIDGDFVAEQVFSLIPQLGYDIHIQENGWLVLTARADILTLAQGRYSGTLGAYYVASFWNLWRLSGGMNFGPIDEGALEREFWEETAQEIPTQLPMPAPHLQLWRVF